MKKVFLILSVVFLISCGSKPVEEVATETVDSTVVEVVDTTVEVVDTVAVVEVTEVK